MFIPRKKTLIQLTNIIKRYQSQKQRFKVQFDDEINNLTQDEKFKPKRHPGIIPFKTVELPENIKKSIQLALGDTPFKGVLKDSVKLFNYLWSRNYPLDEKDLKIKRKEIEEKVDNILNVDLTDKNQDELEVFQKRKEKKVETVLKQTVHAWKNIQLDKYTALQYLVGRAAADYAVLYKIFEQINIREEQYQPTTFFDFGSGVGTGTWAAQQFWNKSLNEYFTVDTSAEANDLARLILCGGNPDAELPIKKYFQRQFLPATPVKFDIVLSAFSLFELPTAKNRLLTIQNLWNRTNDFLILVEVGTNAGFRIINEARDFILQAQDDKLAGHVYAPCPHDLTCARYFEDTTPCNFPVNYKALSFNQHVEIKRMTYSYVILRKGKKPTNENYEWPRIVRPVLVRSQHAICRLCCDDGKLKEVIFTKAKHGKVLYRCAKASQWGDRLPINIQEIEQDSITEEQKPEMEQLNEESADLKDENSEEKQNTENVSSLKTNKIE